MTTEVFCEYETTVDVDGNVENTAPTLEEIKANPDKDYHYFPLLKDTELKIIETLFPEDVHIGRYQDTGEVKSYNGFMPDEAKHALEIAAALMRTESVDKKDADGRRIPNPEYDPSKPYASPEFLKETKRVPKFGHFRVYRPETTDPDPFLLARETYYSGRWHLVARWGEALASWPEMRERAVAKLKHKFAIQLAKARATVAAQEEMAKVLDNGSAEALDMVLKATPLEITGGIDA